jgi:hypothetical protein
LLQFDFRKTPCENTHASACPREFSNFVTHYVDPQGARGFPRAPAPAGADRIVPVDPLLPKKLMSSGYLNNLAVQ